MLDWLAHDTYKGQTTHLADQYSATANILGLSDLSREFFICVGFMRWGADRAVVTHELSQELVIHVLDGVEPEAFRTCGL
jgi:hypothetical protein